MVAEHGRQEKNEDPDTISPADELMQQINQLARSGAFREAERLREQLIKSNPMALGAIVSTAEVIEEEKTKKLDQAHLDIWSELYSELSREETNCLFFSLKLARVESGKLLFGQGKPNNRLFFLESGQVTLFYRKGKKAIPVSKLIEGDILGEDSFIGISLCPFSAATQSPVEVRYLDRKTTDSWYDTQPGLLDKVADFCRKYGASEATAEQKSSGRRDHRRYPVQGSVTAYILDQQNNQTSVYFKGDLSDMSRSGICFSIRCSCRQTARALLSQKADVLIDFDEQEENTIGLSGTIVKLSYHLHSDYNVHMKFSEVVDLDLFKTFPCDWSAEEKL